MFHIFGFILFLIFIVLFIGFVILWRIVNTFLGVGKRMTGGSNPNSQNQQRTTYQRTSANNERTQNSTSSAINDKKKVFDDDEGEYVEFEEIKEE